MAGFSSGRWIAWASDSLKSPQRAFSKYSDFRRMGLWTCDYS